MESENLIFYDKHIIANVRKPSLVFPITQEGTLGDPMAGDFNPYTGSLSSVHRALLKGINSSTTDCVLDIEYQLLEKENFSYSIYSRAKVPLSLNQDSLLCNIIPKNKSSSPGSKLDGWFSKIDDILNHVKNGSEVGSIQSH